MEHVGPRPAVQGVGVNILVVDDEEGIRELISRRLQALGHHTYEAGTADGAEEILAGGLVPDIVISDICMPGQSGIDLLRKIRRNTPQVEVILMTGYAEVETAARAVDARAFAYLRKPFCLDELLNVIGRALQHIELRAERDRHARRLEELVKELRVSEQRYRTLVEGVPGAVIATDASLTISSASERCRELLGLSPEDLLGESMDALRPAEDVAELHTQLQDVLEQGRGVLSINGRMVRPDGSIVHTEEVVTSFGALQEGGQGGMFWIIQDGGKTRELRAEAELARDYLEAVRRSRSAEHRIIGESRVLKDVLRLIQHIAPTDASVLICGESGTGKELAAESVHINSRRADKPFVVVNCAALPESLLESELFGYKKGAFTGADRDKRGLAEIADGGTLFVDEIGEMTPSVQGKLLRVLECGEFRRLGSTEDRVTDLRVVAATNRDLAKAVRAGAFREDLLYRVDVVRLVMPPLRDRIEDVPLIVEYLLERAAGAARRPKRLQSSALSALMAYHWPGNVRELSNVIERAVILSGQSASIGMEHLSVLPRGASGPVRTLRQLENAEIDKALGLTRGNKSQAAKLLGISRQTLISRLKRRQTEPPQRPAF